MTTVQRGVDNCVRQARRCVWIDLLRVLFLGALATSCRMSDKAPSSGDSTPTGDSATPVDDCDPADGLGVVTVSVSFDASEPQTACRLRIISVTTCCATYIAMLSLMRRPARIISG